MSKERFAVATMAANEYYVDRLGEMVRITFIQSIDGVKYHYPAMLVHGTLVHALIATLQPMAIIPGTEKMETVN
jgi:hypothetical protein